MFRIFFIFQHESFFISIFEKRGYFAVRKLVAEGHEALRGHALAVLAGVILREPHERLRPKYASR